MSNNKIVLSFKDFSFIYSTDKKKRPSVSDITFNLKEGETLILAGPSGSGKSTICYAMNGIIPWRLKGFMKGDVEIFEKSVWNYNFMELSKMVGLVSQNPLDQLITFTVRDEIAFGLENLKYSEEEIEKRINSIAKFMEIEHLLERNVDQLSGGQQQITILSSFLAMSPKILILDEPIAYLDQHSESLLLDRLKKLKESKEFNLTLIIIEHRLSRIIDFADKIIVLDDNGKIFLNGSISDVINNDFIKFKSSNVRVPWICNVFYNLKSYSKSDFKDFLIPTNFQHLIKLIDDLNYNELQTLNEILIDTEIKPNILQKLENFEKKIEFEELYIETLNKEEKFIENLSSSMKKYQNNEKDFILETIDLSFEYPNTGIKAIKNLSIKIEKGDFIGLIGPNGAGKTTFLYLLANLYEPTSGEILYKGQKLKELKSYDYTKKVGFIFQNPENMIFKSSIKEEILYGPKNFGMLKEIDDNYLTRLINLIGKEDREKNPYNLSWGQKRRLNLSSIFVYNPEIILLDEPFIGQDQKTIDSLIETLFIENKRGKTIIISSHDYHLLLKYTKKIVEINQDGTLKDYDLNGNYFLKHKNLGPIILLDKIKEKLNNRRLNGQKK